MPVAFLPPYQVLEIVYIWLQNALQALRVRAVLGHLLLYKTAQHIIMICQRDPGCLVAHSLTVKSIYWHRSGLGIRKCVNTSFQHRPKKKIHRRKRIHRRTSWSALRLTRWSS